MLDSNRTCHLRILPDRPRVSSVKSRPRIEGSKGILAQLEDEHLDGTGRAKIARRPGAPKSSEVQLTLFGPAEHPLLDEVRQLDLDTTPPLAALEQVKRWQDQLAAEKKKQK